MTTRQQINDRIEAYAKAVRDRNPDAVACLFAERFDHRVHGLGTDPSNPWNTKKETSREGIRRIYADFFSNAADMAVEYTDRIIDVENRSAAVVVRVSMESGGMENALHIKWNDRGEIILFYNWYGAGVEKI